MVGDPEYQCKRMEKANYMSLSVLIDYLLAPMNRRYSLISEEAQAFHELNGLNIGGIFELLVHVPDCDSCKEFYYDDLNVKVRINLERIQRDFDKYTRGEKIYDLRTRTEKALEVIQ